MSKRIAILNEDLNLVSGGRRVAVNLANMFSIENTVFCINFYKRECSYKLNRNIKIIDILRYPHRYVIDIILISGELHSYIKKNQIEYLFSIGRSMSLVALIAVLFTKCKLVVCEQSSLYGYERMMNYTWKLRIVNKIVMLLYKIIPPYRFVFLTHQTANLFMKRMDMSNKKVISIYNWIDSELLNNTSTMYNIDSQLIITVGRIDFAKGYEYLVKIAKIVFSKYPSWKWHIYGDGDENYKKKLNEMIISNQLEKNVFFMGNHSNIYSIYSKYSFFVMTSRFEGLPMVLLEAKAKKLPLIAFDIETGPSEIIRDGIDGFLVEAFNIKTMSNKIMQLIEDRELRRIFSENASGNLDKFEKSKIQTQWMKIIKGIES